MQRRNSWPFLVWCIELFLSSLAAVMSAQELFFFPCHKCCPRGITLILVCPSFGQQQVWHWPCQMCGKVPEASYRIQPCSPPSYQHLAMQTKYTELFGRLEGERRKIPLSGIESEEPDPPLFMSSFLNTLANLLQSSSELLLGSFCLPKAGHRVSAESSWLCEDSPDPKDGK